MEERKAQPRIAPAASAAAASPAASARQLPAAQSAAEAAAAKLQLPGWENAGKPGYHTVRPGDTLIRIGLDNGQNWRDIARWSGLDNPNIIEVGQVLRVVPPGVTLPATVVSGNPSGGAAVATAVASASGTASARPLGTSGVVESRGLDGKTPVTTATSATPATTALPVAAAGTTSAPPLAASSAAPATPVSAAPPVAVPREGDDDVNWSWPAAGPVATPFDDVKSKGLAITGKPGDPVLAAADGRVVYVGSGLRGYGNLVIVKHNATYLTAYAHNQKLLVKEDDAVRRGQKIAEMGSSDSDRVQLHFEMRRLGKPVDPARLLPPR